MVTKSQFKNVKTANAKIDELREQITVLKLERDGFRARSDARDQQIKDLAERDRRRMHCRAVVHAQLGTIHFWTDHPQGMALLKEMHETWAIMLEPENRKRFHSNEELARENSALAQQREDLRDELTAANQLLKLQEEIIPERSPAAVPIPEHAQALIDELMKFDVRRQDILPVNLEGGHRHFLYGTEAAVNHTAARLGRGEEAEAALGRLKEAMEALWPAKPQPLQTISLERR